MFYLLGGKPRMGTPRYPIWRHLVLTLLAATVKCQLEEWSEDTDELVVPLVDVEAVVGRTATLPCNIEPETKEDRVYMILWYRSNSGKPFYSFDVRGRGFSKALHWSDPDIFGSRAYLIAVAEPATLKVDGITLGDEGMYRCRVDFRNSPTKNCKVRLHVIVPPQELILKDKNGSEVFGVVGPYTEGQDLELQCQVRGGRPHPSLSWFVNNESVPATETHLSKDARTTVKSLRLPALDRSWLNSTVKCQANNTKLLAPFEKTSRIEMYLRPTSVKIVRKPFVMSADDEVTLECVVHGSRPAARITWYRGDEKCNRGKLSEHVGVTSSRSVLRLAPLPSDNEATLRCVAVNPVLHDSTLQDSFNMNVIYRPEVTLTLGSTLNPNNIKEGGDVYFECQVKANPKQHKILWFHEEKPVIQNISLGIIISGHSLVLQKITRSHAGHYSCSVANSVGETISQLVKLRVQYAPVCSLPSPLLVGGKIDEVISIKCVVNSDPTDVNFVWYFNNSGESFQVDTEKYENFGVTSTLHYKATSDRDYGSLHCRGTNSVGTQSKPCVFQVLPAARPSPPRNCSVNTTTPTANDVVLVKCQPGYDGGLSQHFLLEAVIDHNRVLMINTSANYIDDSVTFLFPVRELPDQPKQTDLFIYARNNKGFSDPTFLTGIIVVDYDENKPDTVTVVTPNFPLTVLLGLGLATIGVFCGILLFCCRRRSVNPPLTQTKRPAQTVVQMDSNGRRYVVAYPDKQEKNKPDIISAKTDHQNSRVILESYDNCIGPPNIEEMHRESESLLEQNQITR